MTGRFDQPGLLATVTRAAILDGTPRVIMNAVTHATARRRRRSGQGRRPAAADDTTTRGTVITPGG